MALMPEIRTGLSYIFSFPALLIIAVALSSCKIYSFTGANVPPNVKSLSVETFPNASTGGPVDLGQRFTESLKDKFTSEATLDLRDRDGDLEFAGAITAYTIQGMAPTAGQTTALNRLTISVNVEFTNNKYPAESWTQTFSRFAEYESSQTLTNVENRLIEEIFLQLMDDIFNKALVNW